MSKEAYPKQISVNGEQYTFRLMESTDRGAVLALANRLTEADISFLSQDITQPEIVDSWMHEIKTNRAITLLIEHGGQLIGYGSLHYNQLFWTRHLGELRIMVTEANRNRGLGAQVTRELLIFARELELEKVVAYMNVQALGAQRMLESLRFRAEAVLGDWVKTRDSRTHDLLVMATSLAEQG